MFDTSFEQEIEITTIKMKEVPVLTNSKKEFFKTKAQQNKVIFYCFDQYKNKNSDIQLL